jgi:hypothetical protein
MSWLRELEESSGRAATGRDYVFGKLQGGVAAKLAALEGKGVAAAAAAVPSPAALPRSDSRASNVSASEAYGIEAAPIVRSGAAAAERVPGSVADVVDDGFKRRLEGSLKAAQEQQEKAAAANKTEIAPAAEAGSRVARMAAARRRVPKDVLELIALSGVDEEVAINEYLQHGNLGRTKTWDHEEIMRQVAAEAGPLAGKGKAEEKPETAEAKAEPEPEAKVEEKPVVPEAKHEEKVAEPETKPEEKPVVPEVKAEETPALVEATVAAPAEEKDDEPAIAVAVAVPATTNEEPSAPEFNAAALPALA